jgi:ABC-type microcin C transport system duplicated ATPase subunit YejF
MLIKIVNLVTTGAIVPVTDYLSELKKLNYDTNYLTQFFNEIIIDWNKYTIFAKSDDQVPSILHQIKVKLEANQKLIMVFAYGSAKLIATQAVAEILKKDKGNYFYESKNNTEGDMEVHSSTFSLID